MKNKKEKVSPKNRIFHKKWAVLCGSILEMHPDLRSSRQKFRRSSIHAFYRIAVLGNFAGLTAKYLRWRSTYNKVAG